MDAKLPYRLAALVFVLLVFSGWILDLRGLWRADIEMPTEQLSWGGFREGSNARVIESYLKDNSTLAAYYRPLYNEALYKISGTSSTEISVGKEMLFDRKRTELHNEEFWTQRSASAVDFLSNLNKSLAEVGGKLTVAIVPDRIRVYPSQLPDSGFFGSAKERYYSTIMAGLISNNVSHVNLLELFRNYRKEKGDLRWLYRRDDHHWNELGARLASEAIAKELKRQGVESRDLGEELSLSRYVSTRSIGSLIRRTGWDKDSSVFRMFADENVKERVIKSSNQRSYKTTKDEDVVLLADSMGNFFNWAHVSRALSHPVTDYATASKQSLYAVTRLTDAIGWGYRPRHVILLLSELGTYGANGEFEGWSFVMPQPPSEWQENRITMSALTDKKSVETTNTDGVVSIKITARYGELSLSRAACRGAKYLVFYVKANKRSRAAVNLGLLTKSAMGGRIRENRVQVLDIDQDFWQRVVLPIPIGTDDLILAIGLRKIGQVFQVRDLGIIEAPSPTPPSFKSWLPTGLKNMPTKGYGRNPRPPKMAARDAKNSVVIEAERSGRFFFTNKIGPKSRIRVHMVAETMEAWQSGRIVLSLFLGQKDGKNRRLLRQMELDLQAQETKTAALELPISEEGFLGCELRIPRSKAQPHVVIEFK